jgi:hypothetical protein
MLNSDFGRKAKAPQETYYSNTFDFIIFASATSQSCLYPITMILSFIEYKDLVLPSMILHC